MQPRGKTSFGRRSEIASPEDVLQVESSSPTSRLVQSQPKLLRVSSVEGKFAFAGYGERFGARLESLIIVCIRLPSTGMEMKASKANTFFPQALVSRAGKHHIAGLDDSKPLQKRRMPLFFIGLTRICVHPLGLDLVMLTRSVLEAN